MFCDERGMNLRRGRVRCDRDAKPKTLPTKSVGMQECRCRQKCASSKEKDERERVQSVSPGTTGEEPGTKHDILGEHRWGPGRAVPSSHAKLNGPKRDEVQSKRRSGRYVPHFSSILAF
jgi:hypothetical protein